MLIRCQKYFQLSVILHVVNNMLIGHLSKILLQIQRKLTPTHELGTVTEVIRTLSPKVLLLQKPMFFFKYKNIQNKSNYTRLMNRQTYIQTHTTKTTAGIEKDCLTNIHIW